MNRMTRTLIALALMLLMLLPLCASAFAASSADCAEDLRLNPYAVPSGQYYESADADTDVYTVQVAVGGNYDGAMARAGGLIAKGLDGFVLNSTGAYYVMCGKFYSEYDALCYGELIHTDPAERSAYMTPVTLPKKAVDTFQYIFYGAVRVCGDSSAMETHWEDPTGAYFRSDAEDTVEVYTVQISRGTCFTRAEFLRDRMERYGYPAFVYKTELVYKIMTGMFEDRSEAKEYCRLISSNTQEYDGVVKSARVPVSELESFSAWWSEQK